MLVKVVHGLPRKSLVIPSCRPEKRTGRRYRSRSGAYRASHSSIVAHGLGMMAERLMKNIAP